MTTTIDRVSVIWEWCRDAYLRRGHRLAMPHGTDHTKTYQWRYLTSLVSKLDDWGFDDETKRHFIDVAVDYAKGRGLLRKGLAIFFQRNLLQECYVRLRADITRRQTIVDLISGVRAWLLDAAAGRPLVDVLLTRERLGAYVNLTKWHLAGRLPESYLAMSRSCGMALLRLTQIAERERKLLPTTMKLVVVQTGIVRDATLKTMIKKILQDDWRMMCQ